MSKNNDLKTINSKGLLKKINRDINDSISKISCLPKIEVENFSSQVLKAELIPILEEAKNRVNNIKHITNNLLAIRKEILEPVNDTMQKNSKTSNYFSIIGLLLAMIGIFLSIQSSFDGFFLVDQSPLPSYSKSKSDIEIEISPRPIEEDSPETLSKTVNKNLLLSRQIYLKTIINCLILLQFIVYILGLIYKPRFLSSLAITCTNYSQNVKHRPTTFLLRTNYVKRWLIPFYPETIYMGNILFKAKRKNKISFIVKDKDVKKIYIDEGIELEKSKEHFLLIGSVLKIESRFHNLKKYELFRL